MDYLYHILVMACLYVILSTSFNIVIGLAGMFALSHAAFYAIGAYTVAILTTRLGLPFPIPLLLGAALTGALGMAAAIPALRVGGHYLVIVTLALQVIVVDTLRNFQSLTGGPDGISGIPQIHFGSYALSSPGRFLILAAAATILCFLIARRVERSPFGRSLRAMRENELAAESVGLDVVAMKLKAFALSAALAAVAGGLLAQYIGFVGPQSFTIEETIFILGMVILGGTGNLAGSAVGAVVLVSLPEALKFLPLPYATADFVRNMIYGLILIAVLFFRPRGLLPETHSLGILLPGLPGTACEWFGTKPAAASGPTLVGSGLCKAFGGIQAANGVDIALGQGRVTGLIGPNGAGKTTAFNLLTGFLAPNGGRIMLRDREITHWRPHRIVKAGLARSFQDLKLFRGMTVLENVLVALPGQVGGRLLGAFFLPLAVRRQERDNLARAASILSFFGLGERLLAPTDALSYAEEKLLVIARLVATGAEVLLLDEPLSGLDPTTLAEILPVIRRLAEAGHTVCLIEHNLDVIRDVCDVVYYLDEGRVVAEGRPEELMRNQQLVERYLR